MAVMDDQGIRKPLGAPLACGGEGTIYQLADRADILIKIYHPVILSDHKKHSRLKEKISLMVKNKHLNDSDVLAWPRLPLFTVPDGQWCGYAMYRRAGTSLRELLGNPRNIATTVPTWHRQHLVRLCLDFLDTIKFLSASRTLPVDFNPSNFLVDTQAVRLNFIDCDGYQFQGETRIHLGEAVLPEMAAPEVASRASWAESPVSPESLRFSVGMLLFYILNLGNSPYRHRNGSDPVQNLINGSCALGRGANCRLPQGSAYLIWSHLIYDLKELFIRCFREGHSNTESRPSLAEWREALLKYNHCLLCGHTDPSLIPSRSKNSNQIQFR